MRTLRLLAPLALACVAVMAHAGNPFDTAFGTLASGTESGAVTGRGGGDSEPLGLSASVFDYTNSYYGTAGVNAYGNLGSGKVGAAASIDLDHHTAWVPSYADATGAMWDTVTIEAGSGLNLGIIPLRFALDGYAKDSGTANVQLSVLDLNTNEYVLNVNEQVAGNKVYDTKVIADPNLPPLTEERFKIFYSVSAHAAAYPDLGIYTSDVDFSHTLKFGWDLPAGATFTSASGVFNPPSTAAVLPVPEPTPFIAMAVGAIGLMGRRRRA